MMVCPSVVSTTQQTGEFKELSTAHKMFDGEKQNLDKKIEGDYYAIRIRLNIRPQEILGSG